jgi:polysaccharide transporter, PST family
MKGFQRETIGQSVRVVFVFTLLQRVIQTGRGILFARLLGPSDYGILMLGFFFIPLAATVAKLGIPAAIARFVPRFEARGALQEFLVLSLLPMLLLGIGLSVLGLFFLPELSQLVYGTPTRERVMLACLASLLPMVLFDSARASFEGLRAIRMSSWTEFGHFLLYTVLGLLVLLVASDPADVLFAHAVSMAVVGLLAAISVARIVSAAEGDGATVGRRRFYPWLMSFSLWFAISPILNTILTYTDRWMLNRLLTSAEVGTYSVAVNIANLVFMFGTIAGRVMLPNLSAVWESGERDRARAMLNSALRINLFLLFTAAAALYLLRGPLVMLLYGRDYATSSTVLGLLLCFKLFTSLVWTGGTYAQLVEKTFIPLVTNCIALVANVSLNSWLIPRYGILGAGIATMGAYSLVLSISFAWFRRLGLRYDRATLVAFALPLTLLLPTGGVAVILILFLTVTWATNLFLSRDEKNQLLRTLRGYLRGPRQ